MCTELPSDEEKNDFQQKIVAFIDSQSRTTGSYTIEKIEMASVLSPPKNTAGYVMLALLGLCFIITTTSK